MVEEGYKGIFKSTALFGFVQIFKAVISVVKAKLVALLLGPQGIGLLGVFNSAISMIQTACGLGISQSAVRDISEAYQEADTNKLAKVVSITNKVVIITGSLGCLLTILFSEKISIWTTESDDYTLSFIFLGIVVLFNIINEGKTAIIKGTRHLKYLAFSSIIGTFIGLFTAVPLYYFWGTKGIVPELIIASLVAVVTTQIFINRIGLLKVKQRFRDIYIGSKSMIKMGSALMFTTLTQSAISFIITSYISNIGGLNQVGYYGAASIIINNYFAIIIAALTTDYYPRIAAVNKSNSLIQLELRKQSSVSVILCCPMFVFLVTFVEFVILVLYSKEFLPAIEYLRFGIYYTLITICSNQVDMILVAKGNTRIFLIFSILLRSIQLFLCLGLYHFYGLLGLGIAYALLGIMHMIIMCSVVYRLYHIYFDVVFVRLFLKVILLALISTLVSYIPNILYRTCLGSFIVVFSLFFSYRVSKKQFDLDIIAILRHKLFKK